MSEILPISSSDKGSHGYPRKRARTRRSLLQAGMAGLAAHGPDGLTVADVAARAHVATGTVYNHFPSLADLVEAIVTELTEGVVATAETLDQLERDPAAIILVGTRQMLDLATADHDTARAFVTLLDVVPSFRARVRAAVVGPVRAGVRSGRFAERSVSLTADALLGAVTGWMRARLSGEWEPEPEGAHFRILLALVGLPDAEVDEVLARVAR